MTIRVSWMLTCLLLVAACSTTTGAPATTTPEPTPTTIVAVTTTTTAPLVQATTTTAAPATTVAHEPLGRELPARFLLVDEEGLWFVSDDGSFLLLATGDVRAAFDDRAGGFVVQGDPYGDEPGAIYRLRAGSSDLEAIVTPGEEEFVVLESVVDIDGVPTMLYMSATWYNNPSTASEVLVEVDLETGAKHAVTTTGGWEWGATRVSFGGDVYAIEGGSYETRWLDFVDRSGFVLDYPTNPFPGTTDCPSDLCPGSVISPDGLNLVYVRPVSADGAELVNLFLGSGAENSYAISEVPFWLDFDGSIVAAHLMPPGSEAPDTVVYQLSDTGLVEHARLPGRASIARSVINIGGPVEVP